MSKALAILFTGIGTSAVAVGGVVLTKGLGNGKSDSGEGKSSGGTTGPKSAQGGQSESGAVAQSQSPSTSELTISTAELKADTLSDFKTGQDKFSECAKYYFSGLNSINTDAQTLDSGSNKVDSNYFSTPETPNQDPKSCLIVNWKKTGPKTTDTSSKWKGDFKLEWSLVKGNKGFLIFGVAKPSSEEKKLDFEGGIYILEKETGDSGTWSIKKKKEVTSNKTIDGSNFDDVFPKIKDTLTSATTPHLGFVSSKADLENLCKKDENDCPDSSETEKTFKGAWVWSKLDSGTEGSLTQWYEKPETCFFNVCDKDEFDIKASLATFKGSWEQRKSTSTPEASGS